MKNLTSVTLLAIVLSLCGCTEKEPSVESIDLNVTEAVLETGDTLSLSVTVSPSSIKPDAVTWRSFSKEVASVSSSGVVRALSEGSARITASLYGQTASCTVTVVRKALPASSVDLDRDILSLLEGSTGEIHATLIPAEASGRPVSWETSNPAVATVKDGVVSALKEGRAVITAKADDASASCTVNVYGASSLNPIPFADANLKSKLVDAYDSDGDGELSYFEAASVTVFKDVFGGEKAFKSFDEFEFFTCVTSIREGMFEDWDLRSIKLPDSIRRINRRAFKGCGLMKSIVIPDSVTELLSSAFEGCQELESITLSKSLKRIEERTFRGCTNLKSIHLPESVTSVGNEAFWSCWWLSEAILSPSLKIIGDAAFYDCRRLSSIDIPDSVTDMGWAAFSGCYGLSSVRIGNSLKYLDERAFYQCTGIPEIVIPDSVMYIGDSAFYGCSGITALKIGSGVTSIGDWAFFACRRLASIVIPDSVKTIGAAAFGSCDGAMGALVIPDSVTEIGGGAFASCYGLTSVSLPSTIEAIESTTFYECLGLSNIVIPDSVKRIGERAFASGALTSIEIPDSVQYIEEAAFRFCTQLKTVTVGRSIRSIGRQAFCYCEALESVTVLADSPPRGGEDMFLLTNDCPIYVPEVSLEQYRNAWTVYLDRIMAIPATGN